MLMPSVRRGLRLIAIATFAGLVGAATAQAQTAASQGSGGEVMTDVGGYKVNSLLVPAGPKADLPPLVFIHGASTSHADPVLSFRAKLEGRAEMLFIDRPGHGRSQSGGEATLYPDAQADAIAAVMEARGMDRAIIVGHSFGGAVTAAFALRHPDKVRGLVFLSPAVYPWTTGVAWYYRAAGVPVTGWIFSTLVAPPVGALVIGPAIKSVFAPNEPPANYLRDTDAFSTLAPAAFRHNAMEVALLSDWAKTASPNYPDIKAPTIIITGDTDSIVSPQVHAEPLARAIKGARLLTVRNLGHKSDYVASDLAIAAIETLSGKPRNLERVKAEIEARIADDDAN